MSKDKTKLPSSYFKTWMELFFKLAAQAIGMVPMLLTLIGILLSIGFLVSVIGMLIYGLQQLGINIARDLSSEEVVSAFEWSLYFLISGAAALGLSYLLRKPVDWITDKFNKKMTTGRVD